MSAEEAIALVARGSGTHFDPGVAAALLRIHDRGDLNLDAMPSEIRQMLPRL
jgi:HD-GYP domain-containing protein (c-di-GMP phosphodiesterase class II)